LTSRWTARLGTRCEMMERVLRPTDAIIRPVGLLVAFEGKRVG
jgi:hypothetical protein